MRGVSQTTLALVGLVGAVLLGAGTWFAAQAGLGAYAPGYEITAVFDAVGQGLDQYSDVRVRGVPVGQVQQITYDEDGRAVVVLRIEPDHRVARTAVASVEPLSVFGPKFIALDQGAGEVDGPFLGAGEEIAETTAPAELRDLVVELDEILGALDPDDLVTILGTTSDALRGRGGDIADLVDGTEVLAGRLATDVPVGLELLSQVERLTTALDGVGPELSGVADRLDRTLPVLTDRDADFAGLLDETQRLSQSLVGLLDRTAGPLGDVLEGLEPATDALSTRSDELVDVVRAIEAIFRVLGEGNLDVGDGSRAGAFEVIVSDDICTVVLGPGAACPLDLPGAPG